MGKIKGIDKAIKNIKKFGKEFEHHIDQVIEEGVFEMVSDAKKLAPVDLGKLRQDIQSQKLKDRKYLIFVGGTAQKYAPYVEFGTGNRVNLQFLKEIGLPDSYAAKFKGAGVKQVNLSARPYFFPAIIIGQNEIEEELNDVLKKLTKKYGSK